MNRHHAERACLLYLARSGVPKRRPPGPITRSNYAAVYTQPANCPAPLTGPCLIWRHSLDTHGYGILHLNGKPCRAHRVAYEMTRGEIPERKLILHLCRRRSCIQPAHLYTGTHQQNALDRSARLSAAGRSMEEYSARMHDAMKYYWDEPPDRERTLFQQQTGAHHCVYTIPAAEYLAPDGKVAQAKLCRICFEGDPDWFRNLGGSDPRAEETATRAVSRRSLEPFFEGRGPGDIPLNIVPALG